MRDHEKSDGPTGHGVEDPTKKDVADEENENPHGMTAERMRRVRRKADFRLLPALGLMYGISLMDRKNVANAAIAGMLDDLNLTRGYGYNLITLSFFISYTLFQPVMTVLCRKIGPKRFLSAICFAWGAVIIGFGFVNQWRVMVPLRLLLGLFEAGFFPGSVYLLSTWYTRFEIAKRYSIFYLTGSILSALAGILAYGLMQLEGHGGLRGWRWIFILEGVLTCVVGILAYTLLVKFPDQEIDKPSPFFLHKDEARAVLHHLDQDRGDTEVEPFNLAKFLKPALEIEIWGFALLFFFTTTVSYSFAFFLPVVLNQNLKFSVPAAQCLGSPPYVFSAFVMFAGSWAGDRYKKRALIIFINSGISIIGLPIMAWHSQPAVKYFGIFIAVAGVNANIPAIMAYQANNIRGQWKRAFCSATLTGLGGIGGVAGSLVFRTQDSPGYRPGMIACLVSTIMVVILTGLLTLRFRLRNRQADRGELIIHDSPEFRYTI
jgi:MFS family permease